MVCFLSSLNFRHSSLITHHFKYYTRLAPSLNFHHSIFFTLFVGLIPVTHCRLFFFYPNSPNLVKKKEKKRKRKKGNPEQTEVKERRRRKKRNPEQPTRRRKEKKSQKWSKVAIGYYLWVPYVCLISILLLN